MHIRRADERDLTAITNILNWAIAHSTAHFGLTPTTLEQVRADWQAQHDRYPWLVAEINGAFAGFAKGGPFRPREAYAWTVELTVYVLPAHHGKGLGLALYEHLIDLLRRQGFALAVALVAAPNAASEGLHRRIGLRELGRMPRSGFKCGQWLDVITFGTELNTLGNPPQPTRSVSEVLELTSQP